MNTQRLLEGATFLETLQIEQYDRFNMWYWVHDRVWTAYGPNGPVNHCGTSACAMGWFALKGLWGLEADKEKGRVTLPNLVDREGGPLDEWETAAEVFGLDFQKASWLFHPTNYPLHSDITKEMVAARMRHLAAGGTPQNWVEPA